MEYEIRPYQVQDFSALFEILQLNTPKYFAPEELNGFKEYISENPDTYCTLLSNEEVTGGIGYLMDFESEQGKITWIFVHPEKAKGGIGGAGLRYCLEKLDAFNPQKIVVRTSQLAFTFFEKFGFKITYIEKDYWSRGFDLYEMELSPAPK